MFSSWKHNFENISIQHSHTDPHFPYEREYFSSYYRTILPFWVYLIFLIICLMYPLDISALVYSQFATKLKYFCHILSLSEGKKCFTCLLKVI